MGHIIKSLMSFCPSVCPCSYGRTFYFPAYSWVLSLWLAGVSLYVRAINRSASGFPNALVFCCVRAVPSCKLGSARTRPRVDFDGILHSRMGVRKLAYNDIVSNQNPTTLLFCTNISKFEHHNNEVRQTVTVNSSNDDFTSKT